MRPHLTVEQRQLALRLKAKGLSLREIGPQVGCSHAGVALIVRHASRRPVRHDGWVPGPGRLTLADREEITIGLHAGESFTAIAARLGKAVSTVSRRRRPDRPGPVLFPLQDRERHRRQGDGTVILVILSEPQRTPRGRSGSCRRPGGACAGGWVDAEPDVNQRYPRLPTGAS
jgi:hypothetical protein